MGARALVPTLVDELIFSQLYLSSPSFSPLFPSLQKSNYRMDEKVGEQRCPGPRKIVFLLKPTLPSPPFFPSPFFFFLKLPARRTAETANVRGPDALPSCQEGKCLFFLFLFLSPPQQGLFNVRAHNPAAIVPIEKRSFPVAVLPPLSKEGSIRFAEGEGQQFPVHCLETLVRPPSSPPSPPFLFFLNAGQTKDRGHGPNNTASFFSLPLPLPLPLFGDWRSYLRVKAKTSPSSREHVKEKTSPLSFFSFPFSHSPLQGSPVARRFSHPPPPPAEQRGSPGFVKIVGFSCSFPSFFPPPPLLPDQRLLKARLSDIKRGAMARSLEWVLPLISLSPSPPSSSRLKEKQGVQ